MLPRLLVVTVLLACAPLLRASALPHDDLDRQIAALTEELRRSPTNEALLIRRGDLYRRHRQWDEAFADFAAVRGLRDSETFALARTRLLRDMGFLRAAIAESSAHLSTHARDARVRILRAQVFELRGAHAKALSDLDRALAELDAAQPDHYLARARVAAACAELGERALPRALAGLDQGIAKLGPIPALQLAAIDLELRSRSFDRALERLETILAPAERKERWLAQRADILSAAGRAEEAREAYRASLLAIRSLKPKLRSTSAIRELEGHVLAGLREPAPAKSTRKIAPSSQEPDRR